MQFHQITRENPPCSIEHESCADLSTKDQTTYHISFSSLYVDKSVRRWGTFKISPFSDRLSAPPFPVASSFSRSFLNADVFETSHNFLPNIVNFKKPTCITVEAASSKRPPLRFPFPIHNKAVSRGKPKVIDGQNEVNNPFISLCDALSAAKR